MARTSIEVTAGPESREWERKFDGLGGEMADRTVPKMDAEVGVIYGETQALVHIYPQGAHYPPIAKWNPTRRDIERAGRLKASGHHQGARREGDDVVDEIAYRVPWAEFERTGTSRSIPPYREHDFMAPWVPGMERVGLAIDDTWREIWA